MPSKLIRKTILRDGEYRSPDGVVKVTPDRRKHWAEQFRRMSEQDAKIPVGWDHATEEDSLVPLSTDEFNKRSERSARDTIGRLVSIEDKGDAAEITVEITDPVAIGRAERNEVYVSPVIAPKWTNSRGVTFEDCFTHVDFVNHPVDHSQKPFVANSEPGVIACALRMSLSTQPYTFQVIRMAKDDDGRAIEGFFTDDYGVTHPITSKAKKSRGNKSRSNRKKKKKMSLVRMGDLPDDEKDKKNKKEGEEGGSEAPNDALPQAGDTPTETPEKTKVEELVAGGEDEGPDIVDGILELLQAFCDIVLPEDTTDDNLLDRLNVALHTGLAMKNKSEAAATPEKEEEEQEDEELKVAQPNMQTMSLESQAAVSYASNLYREHVSRDLKQLLEDGKCTPDEHSRYSKTLGTVKLSLDASGKPTLGTVENFIASREPVPKGTFWTDAQKLSLVRPIDQPQGMDGKLTDEQVKEAVSWALGRKS